AIALPIGLRLLEFLRGPTPLESGWAFLRATSDEFNADAARVGLHLVFLASHAYEMVDAITVTLVRLSITGRRLLEWETAAASDRRGGPPRLSVFVKDMIASPLIAVWGIVLVAAI